MLKVVGPNGEANVFGGTGQTEEASKDCAARAAFVYLETFLDAAMKSQQQWYFILIISSFYFMLNIEISFPVDEANMSVWYVDMAVSRFCKQAESPSENKGEGV